MTNDIQYTATNTTARRTGRVITVVAAAAGALLWTVDGPWAGLGLAVRQGDTTQNYR